MPRTKSHDRDFVAADCGFAVFVAAVASLDGDQILPRRQIGIERKLHPCRVGEILEHPKKKKFSLLYHFNLLGE